MDLQSTSIPMELKKNDMDIVDECANRNNVSYTYTNYVGINLAVSAWEAFITILVLFIIIILTIIGNVLVILSVFTYKPLRIVQNFFIVSLAVADLTVAILVLPLNVVYIILGRWEFGINLCKMWLTCDVLCCTSSILNLCTIALDRYWAITDPINYAQKRTVGRVLILIAVVWILSLIISSPPLIGWNDWPENFSNEYPCQLNSNQGYIIYSSLGSFYIPLIIMTIVYVEIYVATRRRLRERGWALRNNAMALTSNYMDKYIKREEDEQSESSVTNYNSNIKVPLQQNNCVNHSVSLLNQSEIEDSATEIPEISLEMLPQNINCNIVSHEHNLNKRLSLSEKRSIKSNRTIYQFIEERQKISLSKERRAARTLGIIMGVFVICWLPFFLMYVILPFCSTCCPTEKLRNFITWLGYINSGLNPVIYTIFNLDYRRAFKRLLGIQN